MELEESPELAGGVVGEVAGGVVGGVTGAVAGGITGSVAGGVAGGVDDEPVEVEPPAVTPTLTVTTRDAVPVFPAESVAV